MVSIAARNLLHDRTRVAVSAGGVGFAIMLILILAGTYDGFYRQAGLFTENSGADLFVGQAGVVDTLHSFSILPLNLTDDLAGVPGVERVCAIISRTVELHVGDSDHPRRSWSGTTRATGRRGRGESSRASVCPVLARSLSIRSWPGRTACPWAPTCELAVGGSALRASARRQTCSSCSMRSFDTGRSRDSSCRPRRRRISSSRCRRVRTRTGCRRSSTSVFPACKRS